MSIETIIALGRKFSSARSKLSAIMDRIVSRQREALDRERAALREAVNKANEVQAELRTAIESSPELFTKPRTISVNGIRLGMTTRNGRIDFVDGDTVVERIEKKFPAFAHQYIIVKKTPNKHALENLTDEQLETIGCVRLPDDPNAVVIKPTDSEVDKLVSRLLENVDETRTEALPA